MGAATGTRGGRAAHWRTTAEQAAQQTTQATQATAACTGSAATAPQQAAEQPAKVTEPTLGRRPTRAPLRHRALAGPQ